MLPNYLALLHGLTKGSQQNIIALLKRSQSTNTLHEISLVIIMCILASMTNCYYPYAPYSARMSPENTHKIMAFYMEVLILGVIL